MGANKWWGYGAEKCLPLSLKATWSFPRSEGPEKAQVIHSLSLADGQRQWWLLHAGEEKQPCRNVTLHFSASIFFCGFGPVLVCDCM